MENLTLKRLLNIYQIFNGSTISPLYYWIKSKKNQEWGDPIQNLRQGLRTQGI